MEKINNMTIYEIARTVPEEAKKEIGGGRLKGMTDINPMYRIKRLTELFGPCGIGWKYTIDRQWLETGFNEEICAFTNISLYVKVGDEWSEAIPGTGGSAFIAKEKFGPYTSDECFKMSLTDALSVACKALGIAADVYWQKDRTKYDQQSEAADYDSKQKADKEVEKQTDKYFKDAKKTEKTADELFEPDNSPRSDLTKDDTVKIKKALNSENQSKAKELLKAWGISELKFIPHSRVDEFISQL